MSLSWRFSIDERPLGVTVWPARISVPLPREAGAELIFSVQRPDGTRVPAQARALTAWPDGSPRWVQLEFQMNETGEYTAEISGCQPMEEIALPVEIEKTTIRVGRLSVEFEAEAPSPITRLCWNGQELAVGACCVFRLRDEGGRLFPIAGSAKNVRVEAAGHQRYQVSWENEHRDSSGQKLLDVRFRIEFLAGVEGFSLSYHFFHKLPGRDFIHLQGIDGVFTFDGLAEAHGHEVVVQQSQGLLGMRRFVRTSKTVNIQVDSTQRGPYVENLLDIHDDCEYPYFLARVNNAVSPIVALENDLAAVAVVMHDMQDLRPKTMTVTPGTVRFEIWPESAGTLKLPQGRSAAHRFSFLCTDPGEDRLDPYLAASRAAYLEPSPGWLDPADSGHAGAAWDAPRLFTGTEPGVGIFASIFSNAYARYEVASGLFDFGDSPHAGYTTGYATAGMRRIDDISIRNIPMTASLGGYEALAMSGMVTPQELDPVWANNEYDAIYALALEALRTHNRHALNKLRAVSRHQIEVDFIHYSDFWQHHRGTPCHTYDHNGCSTAYPSHQWTQGLYYYYCMTGDDDVPEVIRALCDFNIAWLARPELQINHYFNRELGWALIALVFGYELTGEDKYRSASASLIRELEGYSGKEDFDKMYKSCSTQIGSNERLLGRAFGVNTVPMGVRMYHQATGEDWARELLFRWVDIGFAGYNDRASGPKLCDMFPECFTYVCELTGDTRYLRDSLWQLNLLLHGYGNIWAGNGPIDAKLYGRLYRGLVHNVSACAKAGLLASLEAHFLGDNVENIV